jgi:hypothetical protein
MTRLRRHWPEYLMEAAGLGLFMLSAASFATLLEHPLSPMRGALPDALLRRLLMGLAMGTTRARGLERVLCAKLHHHTTARGIFHCRFGELPS